MIRKKKIIEDDGELKLSDELAELDNAISLEDIRKQELEETESVAGEALYTDEELKEHFEQAEAAAAAGTDVVPTLEPADEGQSEALYSSDKELEKALEKKAQQEKEKPKKEPATSLPTAKQSAPIPEPPAQEIIDLSIFLTGSDKLAEHTRSNTPPKGNLPVFELAATGINNSPLVDDTHCDEKLDALALKDFVVLPSPEETAPPKEEKAPNKISGIAKSLLKKNKAQFNEYFGRSLPERELPLDFIFPPLKSKKEMDPVVSSRDITKLFSIKGTSNNVIFKKADEDLEKLIRCNLAKSQKLELLNSYSEKLIEKAKAVITLYEKRPSVSDSKRSEMAEHALSVFKHLISGYKQVYAEIYESTNYLYGPQRSTANSTVFKLFDILCLEQQLTIALQTPTPSSSIKTFNTLFHAISRYEPQMVEESLHSVVFDHQTTIKAMFIRYQINLTIDFKYFSSSQHKVIHQYIQSNMGLVQLLPLDDSPSSSEPLWMIPHDNSDTPMLASAQIEQPVSSPFSAVFIRLQTFLNQIKKDYAESIHLIENKQTKHSSTAFNSINIADTLFILSALNKLVSMVETQTNTQTYSLYRPLKLRVYAGLAECASYFSYLYASQNKVSKGKDEPEIELPPKPTVSKAIWQYAMEDDETMYLQTNEPQSKIALDVGEIILLIKTTEGIEETILASITRLERDQQGKIKLIIEKLGTKATDVSFLNSADKLASAIVTIKGEGKYLIAANNQHFHSDQIIGTILPDESNAPMLIEKLKLITQKIQILELA